LKPTKGNSLIKKTADDLNLSEEMVKDIVDFYYSTVAKKLESLKYPTLYLHGLGTLRLSMRKLKRDIEGLNKLLNSSHGEDFRKVIRFNLSTELMNNKIKALETCQNYYKEINEKRNSNLEK
jgi:nucleoid DNA-binding protein